MATDYATLAANLCSFYDFTDKVVLFIGAGNKQLLDPAVPVKKLIAIDKDVEALRELKSNIAANGLQHSVEVVSADFEDVALCGDTVYFEFCLHEMNDPEKALIHAKSLAPDIVVYDHSPGSTWSYCCVEQEKVSHSSAAMERFGVRRRQTFHNTQRFENHAELLAKVGSQGPLAIERAQKFKDAANIVIPMDYELNLL